MTFHSYSQAGQDQFVWETIGKPERRLNGTFLDVGCGHPLTINNTAGLERMGWRGLLVDNSQEAVDACVGTRLSPVIKGDATSLDWNAVLATHLPQWNGTPLDFLSLDIDEATPAALNAILSTGAIFRVICVEHDAYRHGSLLRDPIRKRLAKHDYDLVCADVRHAGLPFEDWHVHPDLVDMEIAGRYRSIGFDWQAILKLGGEA